MMNLENVRTILEKRDRAGLTEIVANGANLPGVVRAAAYVYIQSMPSNKFAEVCSKGLEAVGFLQTGDIDGLKKFSAANGVPPEILNLISQFSGAIK